MLNKFWNLYLPMMITQMQICEEICLQPEPRQKTEIEYSAIQ